MKKWFDEDSDVQNVDKAKIIVTIIPFVLIILVLAVTLIVNAVKNGKKEPEDLQQNIMEYADENKETDDMEPANSSAITTKTAEPQPSPNKTPEPTAAPTATPYQAVMKPSKTDYSKIEFNAEEQLKEMMTYWADNNQKALDDLANLDRFIAMSWKLRGTKECYYYGDKDGSGQPNGTGIAVYADNQYYYGDWKNGVRSGTGTWIHYHIHLEENKTDLYTYHQYTGSWAGDLPDGEGSEHYDYDISLFEKNARYNNNLIGSYSKGLINGDFYLTNIDDEEDLNEWNAKADHGSWVYLNASRDKNGRGPVQVDTKNPDNYIWLHPKDNVNIGVPCLISKNKNQ